MRSRPIIIAIGNPRSSPTFITGIGLQLISLDRLGGQVVSQEVNQPGFDKAGYVNVTTSDNVVHGQVKQSDAFSFVGNPSDSSVQSLIGLGPHLREWTRSPLLSTSHRSRDLRESDCRTGHRHRFGQGNMWVHDRWAC